MSGDAKRRLDPREAARIIYRTADPTPQQVESVRRELARGHLQGDRDGRWTTTGAVAAYLAGRSYEQHDRGRGRATPAGSTGFVTVGRVVSDTGDRRRGAIRSNDTLVSLYRELLQDYFLAVLRRRKQEHRSQLFQRAVVVGQVACILVLVGLFVFGLRVAQSLRQPPEQAAVARWIAQNDGDFDVIRWYPTEATADGTGALVRVEFQYYSSTSRKRIVTTRAFEVRGDEVKVANDSDPEEDQVPGRPAGSRRVRRVGASGSAPSRVPTTRARPRPYRGADDD